MRTLFFLFESKGRAILVVTVLLSLTFDLLGSFQLTERLDAIATNLLGAVYGPLYGWNDRVGQKKITVLLINRQTLDALHTDRWPPDYSDEADFAEWAAAYKPAAIFMDFYFSRARHLPPTAAPSLDAFFGGGPAEAQPPAYDVEGIKDLGARLERVRASGIAFFTGPVNADDPNLKPLTAIPQVGIERVLLPADSYPARDSQGRLQAAFALYKAVCPEVRTSCPDVEAALKGRNLAIQWGFGAGDDMKDLVPADCRGGSIWERLQSAAAIAYAEFAPNSTVVKNGQNMRYARCAYADAFPIDWLRKPPPGFDPRPYIEGRAVLIGADLPFLADYADAPLLGSVPGVMAHAMALDNLLQSGDKAARYAGTFVMNMSYRDLLELVLVLMGLYFMVLAHNLLKRLAGDERPPAGPWWTVQTLVVILVPVGLGLWMSQIFSWPAVNVFSIASMGVWSLFLLAHDLRGELDAPSGNDGTLY